MNLYINIKIFHTTELKVKRYLYIASAHVKLTDFETDHYFSNNVLTMYLVFLSFKSAVELELS